MDVDSVYPNILLKILISLLLSFVFSAVPKSICFSYVLNLFDSAKFTVTLKKLILDKTMLKSAKFSAAWGKTLPKSLGPNQKRARSI